MNKALLWKDKLEIKERHISISSLCFAPLRLSIFPIDGVAFPLNMQISVNATYNVRVREKSDSGEAKAVR
jgi:hypothetical protein